MQRLKLPTILIIGIILPGCGLSVSSYQTPSYETTKKDGSFEIRHYGSLPAVSHSAHSDNSAFRPLFRYISGDNQQQEKIQMTVPVRKRLDMDRSNLSFFLPERFHNQLPPKPLQEDVRLLEYTEGEFAVLRFSGLTGEEKLRKKQQALEQWIDKQGLAPAPGSEWYLDRYNPPWTPWFMRKNELLVRIE